MVVTIPDLLPAIKLEAVCEVLRRGQFVEGQLSAGQDAVQKKHNLELESSSDESAQRHSALNDVVMSALVQHPDYLQGALPSKIASPIYARYLDGMNYGGHIDDPVMGPPGARYRSDISVTIFLNEPDEYSGGELCIDSDNGSQSYKLPAGSALLYPSTCYHRVAPVTAGERLVAVTWIQSLVRSAEQREILWQLAKARDLLKHDVDAPVYHSLNLSYTNLLRMWAET